MSAATEDGFHAYTESPLHEEYEAADGEAVIKISAGLIAKHMEAYNALANA